MKKFRDITSIFAILMILTFVASIFASAGNANALTTIQGDRATFPYVEFVPKLAGVGQPIRINVGLLNPLLNTNDGWNLTLHLVDPNDKVETFKVKTFATGMGTVHYTPTIAGNYTAWATFENVTYGNSLASSATSNWYHYLSSETGNYTFEARADYWKPPHPGYDMPSEYWTRPVDGQLREWGAIMGNWLIQGPRNTRVTNQYAPYNEAPNSAHILWNMPDDQYPGGISGDFGGINFQHGDAYEGKFYGAIIVAGVLYYNMAPVYNGGANARNQAIRAIDLHTGKILWEKDLVKEGYVNTARLTHGQVMIYFNENNHGAWAYIWLRSNSTITESGQYGSNWYALNPKTGDLIYNITDVPTQAQSAGNQNQGTQGGSVSASTLQPIYFGPQGEMLIYTVVNLGNEANPNWVLCQWNSTRTVAGNNGNWGSTSNTAAGRTFTGNRGACYDWNISLSRNFGRPIVVYPGDRAVFANVTANGVTMSAVHLDEDNFGQMMYTNRYWQAPEDWKSLPTISDSSGQSGWAAFSDDPYVGVYWMKEERINYVFSLDTGRFLWKSDPQHALDGLGGATSNSTPERAIAYGCLIGGSVSGIVHCYNVSTGELKWTRAIQDPHIAESYLTENWWLTLCFISDGKAYFGHHEHSAQVPQPRGAPFFAIDIESGDIVWMIEGAFRQQAWGGRAIIGDGIIATLDSYDSQIYAIGKGPSEVTVAVSNPVTTAGNSVLISGTVMDISPGTESDNLRLRFPKGVPAMSDEYMSDWMLHVYKQFPANELPDDIKGVDVDIYAWDGKDAVLIGTTTSDRYGNFHMTWAPKNTGDYEIWASFNGSESYYHNDAQTAMTVLEAPVIVEPETPPYGWYIAGAAVVIIAAVAIVGLLLFRKISSQH